MSEKRPFKKRRIGKQNAYTIDCNSRVFLMSYSTVVAYQEKRSGRCYVTEEKYSVTTSKHVNKFKTVNAIEVSQKEIDKVWNQFVDRVQP